MLRLNRPCRRWCVYDCPRRFRREGWADGELVWWVRYEMLNALYSFGYVPEEFAYARPRTAFTPGIVIIGDIDAMTSPELLDG